MRLWRSSGSTGIGNRGTVRLPERMMRMQLEDTALIEPYGECW